MVSLPLLLPALLPHQLPAQRPRGSVPRIVADYDAELRGADGRVDTSLLITRLESLGVNCYFWLIWHADSDWEDLRAFLPQAENADIDVWVYLVPPSEPPPSRPFGLDFVRWGEEIATLSLQCRNLRAWVIDDFYANRAKLTPDYIAQMQRAAKKINPDLQFFPLMYYREIHYQFTAAYGNVIDGVVVAYPRDRAEVIRAGRILRDEVAIPPRCVMRYPWDQPSKPGEMVQISQKLTVVPGAEAHRLQVRQRDMFTGATEGYHFKQVLVDEEVVWEEDVVGGDIEWHEATVDLTSSVRGKETVVLTLRALDKKGVSNFGVEIEWARLQLEGLTPAAPNLGLANDWEVKREGNWDLAWHPEAGGNGRFKIPYVVMPAGSPGAFRKRHPGSEGTPEEVASHLKMTLQAMTDGECEGVVTYCLPKQPGDPYFEAARRVIAEMKPRLQEAQ